MTDPVQADDAPAGDAAALARRVAVLEKIVALEKRLRQIDEARRAPPEDDLTVVVRKAHPADDDSTILAPPPALSVLPHKRSAPALPDAAAPLALAPGFDLFEYRIDSVLGQGGFGITYLATDVNLNVKVAIKEYLPAEFAQRANDRSVAPRWPEDSDFYKKGLDNFLVEARTLATFRHPNIVRVARFFEAHRTAYMVLEYERGKPLKQWWDKHRGMSESELLTLVKPLLEGLAVVHGAGFLHRDIKPDNIYVRKDDGSLVLLDFGAARQTTGAASAMAEVVTPGYAPCEQYGEGEQGPWTDLYAFGATLYWMITGAKPPPAPARADGSEAMMAAAVAAQGRYSEAFLNAVDWALMLDSAQRPHNVRVFMQKLYASHAGSLALKDALRAGDGEAGVVADSWQALLESPRLLKRRALQLWHALVRPASWPLAVKMTIAMVLAALLPMTITAYYNVNGAMAAVSGSELRNLERIAQSTAGRVGQLITDSQNMANYMATDPDLIAYLRAPDAARRQVVDARLANLVRTVPDVHLMFLMNADGLALVSSEPGVAGVNFRFREYFQQAMQGHSFKTGIIVGATAGKPGMYYSNPVYDANQKVIGVVVLRIKGATIAAILDQMTAGTDRVPFMIDGDGVLIHHPDQKQLYRSLAPLPADAMRRIVADQRFQRSNIDDAGMHGLAKELVGAKKTGNVSHLSTISGVEEHAGYAPVPGHNWVVGVSESRTVFETPLRRLFKNVLWSVAAVGLVFLILAVLFARSIVRPISRLTDAANHLKEGDYEKAHIKVTSNDEIGRLAKTFNVMIDVLRQRDKERK